ncbi:MAG: protein-L-isoaspartate(D-aspartate) O-methyltransferase [Gammaproteobacteria bacterium]|nr:protein-L-isoaspartate(D-aspartate) O-methyltransferase [Gammaproteobacteria bacterium]
MTNPIESQYASLRQEMVEQIAKHATLAAPETGRDVLSERVMEVMGRVPRHEFVPVELRSFAYFDTPLPIGYDKTISQPFIVALMTDLLDPQPTDHVLDVGTGLGYQAAVLSHLVERVYSIEIIEELGQGAERRLAEQSVGNVELRIGDGSRGWPERSPFDKILVAAAPDLIPTALLTQLKPGGRMVIPAGVEDAQQLMLVEKNAGGQLNVTEVLAVRFSTLIVSH